MQRIILSLALILTTAGALVFGATTAFFSDTETSAANVFTAGAIDLKVDNESYYNGVFNEGTSWPEGDLDGSGNTFFDFDDLKPGDYGEDTISLHVDTNDAFICADVTLTSNNENDQTEPEAQEDETVGPEGEGELADLVQFMWWADDGDNVLEDDEDVISEGTLGSLDIGETFPLVLADSDKNIWNDDEEGGAVAGDETYYIGKAWCFGEMEADPIESTDSDISPAGDNDDNGTPGEPEDGGYSCDGSELGNESQTDSLTADISFSAVQARHNTEFQCEEPEIVACTPSTTNIFVNGGFEDALTTVTHPDLWEVYPAAITGWSIAWRGDVPTVYNSISRPEPGNLELHRGVLGAAHTGNQYAELDSDWDGHANLISGEPASTVISQTIATIPGATYTIDYWFAPRPNTSAATNQVSARWNGVLLDTAGPLAGGGSNLTPSDWIQQGPFVFIATSTSAVISFTDEGTADSLGSFIDDVSVLQTICPPVQ